jgi:hypothetical protein
MRHGEKGEYFAIRRRRSLSCLGVGAIVVRGRSIPSDDIVSFVSVLILCGWLGFV